MKNMKVIKIKKNFTSYSKEKKMDEQVRASFYEMSERINASYDLKRRIDNRILKEEKEQHSMKHFSIKRVVIGVTAACLVLGTVGIAGSGAMYYMSHSSVIPDYTRYADLPKAEAEAGYEVEAVEAFKNGYEMKSIHISEEAIQNEAGQTEESQKGIDLIYDKKGSKAITLNIRKLYYGEREEAVLGDSKPDKAIRCGDTDVIFRLTKFKFVPPDYELTEEDQKNMENGSISISYGTSEVEIKEYCSVSWVKAGIVYGLGGFDLSLSADEMLSMAKEVIEYDVK